MYPSIPKDLGLAAARKVLNQRSVKVPRTDNLMQCLEICLDSNTFEFNNEHFKQIHGTAIGPKMSPAYACLAMGLVDQRMWRESPQKPKKWDRYIDDVMGIWLHGKQAFNEFLEFLNSLYPGVLKFTGELGENGLPFLDTFLRIVDGLVVSELFTKPTDKHLYLRFDSCYPMHSKKSIAYSQALRISLLNSSSEKRDSVFIDLQNHLVNRGHPVSEISSQIMKAKLIPRSEIIKEKPKRQNNRVPFTTTYNPGLPNLPSVIQNHYHILQRSERLKEVFNEPPMVAFHKPESLRQYLVKVKVNNNAESVNVSAEVPGCYKLHNSRCRLCHVLRESDHFTSNVTKRMYRIKDHIDCKSKGVIYLACWHLLHII